MIAAVLVAVVLYVTKLVLQAEYPWWGGKLARLATRYAARVAPRPTRREEWLAELGVCQDTGTAGVCHAVGFLIAAMRLRWAHTREKLGAVNRKRRFNFWLNGVFVFCGVVYCAAFARDGLAGNPAGAALDAVYAGAVWIQCIWMVQTDLRKIDLAWVNQRLAAWEAASRPTEDPGEWCQTESERALMFILLRLALDVRSGVPERLARKGLRRHLLGWRRPVIRGSLLAALAA